MHNEDEQSHPVSAAVEPWTMQSPPGAETILNGRSYLYFAGTGYLGLQGHPAVITAAQAAVERFGVHSATTRSGFGTSPPVVEVERRAARLLGADDAIYLASGYAGNFALAAAISNAVDLVLIDELAHDCLREATRWLDHLKRPPLEFRHRDVGHVEQLLLANVEPGHRPLVLTDGLFPVSGRFAPLADYLSVLGHHAGAMLHVDDAHAVGAVGQQGRGSLELAGVPASRINRDLDEPADLPRVFLSATLSKAVGGHGGVIAGSNGFLHRVRRASGWSRGASAPAAPVAAATAKGLELIEMNPDLRQRLAANVTLARTGLRALGLNVEPTCSPIIGLELGSAPRMQCVQKQLLSEGIAIAYTRDYAGTAPDGTLRIALFATHSSAMILRLVEALGRALQANPAD